MGSFFYGNDTLASTSFYNMELLATRTVSPGVRFDIFAILDPLSLAQEIHLQRGPLVNGDDKFDQLRCCFLKQMNFEYFQLSTKIAFGHGPHREAEDFQAGRTRITQEDLLSLIIHLP